MADADGQEVWILRAVGHAERGAIDAEQGQPAPAIRSGMRDAPLGCGALKQPLQRLGAHAGACSHDRAGHDAARAVRGRQTTCSAGSRRRRGSVAVPVDRNASSIQTASRWRATFWKHSGVTLAVAASASSDRRLSSLTLSAA